MRRIMAFDHLSADGYFCDPEGGLDWVVQDPELSREAAAASAGVGGTLLFGRRTYEMFESFWPHAVDDSPTAPDPHGGARSPEMRAMGVFINESAKIVFSRTRRDVTWKNSRLLHELDPRQVEALKKERGPDMILFGSGSIASQLTEHGLIDEYQIIVGPVLLGKGRPLISGVPGTSKLQLLEAKSYPSGNVKLRYAPAR